jgi:hypothetical protein
VVGITLRLFEIRRITRRNKVINGHENPEGRGFVLHQAATNSCKEEVFPESEGKERSLGLF